MAINKKLNYSNSCKAWDRMRFFKTRSIKVVVHVINDLKDNNIVLSID